MSVPSNLQIGVKNRLLLAIPSQEYERLLPNLTHVSLPFKQVLYEPRELIKYVYFPNNGVVSLISIMSDNTVAEVGLVGNEGMVGISVFLGVETTPLRAIVQVPGDAIRMKADVFLASVKPYVALSRLLRRYTQALIVQISQSAACNSHHSVEQRCCRWLLMTSERVNSDEFPITQEFLSQMLGVRRASVTVVAGILQKAGLIRYSRGQMTILDYPGLEQASCSCYTLVKQEENRLLGY